MTFGGKWKCELMIRILVNGYVFSRTKVLSLIIDSLGKLSYPDELSHRYKCQRNWDHDIIIIIKIFYLGA